MHANRVSMIMVLSAALLLAAGCETNVTNPGVTPDDALDKPEAWPALVVGSRRALANALGSSALTGGQILYWSAALSFEINPAGSTGSFGIPPAVQVGVLNAANTNADWSSANQARYVAEAAVRRFRRVMADTVFARSLFVAQAYLYAGYSNRLLGETFCESVIPVEVLPDSFAADPERLARFERQLPGKRQREPGRRQRERDLNIRLGGARGKRLPRHDRNGGRPHGPWLRRAPMSLGAAGSPTGASRRSDGGGNHDL